LPNNNIQWILDVLCLQKGILLYHYTKEEILNFFDQRNQMILDEDIMDLDEGELSDNTVNQHPQELLQMLHFSTEEVERTKLQSLSRISSRKTKIDFSYLSKKRVVLISKQKKN
jgi:hypothetical protein